MTTVAFATGCSRSGTTALVDLLNAHPQIGIGMERYKYRYFDRDADAISDLFGLERFFDFQAADTNLVPDAGDRWAKFYARIREKSDGGRLTVIGDKPLAAPPIVRMLDDAYPDARWIFIFRDVADVAASYIARADDPTDSWPITKRHGDAVEDCKRAFAAADLLLGSDRDRVFTVAYDELFSGHDPTLQAVNRFLGVGDASEQLSKYADMTRDWDERAGRPIRLSSDEAAWVSENRDRPTERRFRALAEADRDRWLGEDAG